MDIEGEFVTDTLYHYCSPEAFYEIITTKAIRLSSLALSNDYLEGKLVHKALMRLANRDQLPHDIQSEMDRYLNLLTQKIDGLGFCLSAESDLLSQWRGYAADARGVSLGFNRSYLIKLSKDSIKNEAPGFILKSVAYSDAEQDALVEPTYTKLHELIQRGALSQLKPPGLPSQKTEQQVHEELQRVFAANTTYLHTQLELIQNLFALKNHAFCEEQETRLISHLTAFEDDPCDYHPMADRIIPHRSYALKELGEPSIVEVFLGPRHETPPVDIRYFLRRNGFEDIPVRRSAASYR